MGAADRAAGPTPLRILFSMRNFWYVKLFESVVVELASRGHAVHILAERGERHEHTREWNHAAATLAETHATVSFAWAPRPVEDDWADLRIMVRLGLDHLRFLEPDYRDAPMLGVRARRRTPQALVRLADTFPFSTRPGRALLRAALRAAERAVPTSAPLAQAVEDARPDVVLVTPLLTLGSEQVDVLRIAASLGAPSALCVGSWDHLSSKALIRDWPDQVFVWNETQAGEAETLHQVPRDRVVVTGAQCFDQWFGRRPALDREAFCRKVGLDSSRPFILYACSALFEGSPNEAEFTRQWIAAVRSSSDPALRDAGILVRPHPKRGFEWDAVALDDLPNVALWPPRAEAPFDAASKSDYFDSMFHSAVIAGLNTSALIEGGIVGRAVHTVLLPEFQQNQEGTLHFHYLLDGGLLRADRDLHSHVASMARSLAAADPAVHHNRSFVEAFVRPAGIDRAATPLFADAVERVAALRLEPQAEPLWVRGLRRALTPLARRTMGTFSDQIGRERRRLEKKRAYVRKAEARVEQKAALEAQRVEEKARVAEERRLRREARVREREEHARAAHAAKQHAKDQALEAKRRDKAARVADARRRKRRAMWNERLSGYLRRVTRPFSASR
jgi:hypothetical protein